MAQEELTDPAKGSGADRWIGYAVALIEREVAARDDVAATAAAEAVRQAEAALAEELSGDGPLAAIAEMAELEPVDGRVLAFCAAVELDRRLQRLIGRLLHDPGAARPDVDLLVRLIGPRALVALAENSRLSRGCLVEMADTVPLAAAPVSIPRRVLWALLDDDGLDPELPFGASVVGAPDGAIGAHELVLVHGSDRVRRVQAAVVATWGLVFLVTPPPADDAGWRVLVRQATVAGLGIVLELDAGLDPLGKRWIERADHLAWALGSRHPLALESVPDRDFAEVAAADGAAADAEWAAVFPDTGVPKRRPSAQQLRLAALVARPGGDPQEAIRRVATGTLLRHAQHIVPQVTWADLVLPGPQNGRLRELVERYRYRRRVHEEWGLPLYPSPGVVALFSGPSGTGKTTTAEVIAGDLGVDLFRVDLSALVSKYIGETEKNLEEIFSAAHAGDYLLLFDEADALFGSRSKVTDAHDRYANMEISYLLQRLETYDGFVVLTSNFQGNIDAAFLRRIHVTVHFPVPSAAERRRIWARSLGDAPQDDLDLEFVAEKFDLTGGSIRNAALTAAFLAAGKDTAIGMAELLRAINQELTKLSRRATDDQFGRWLPLLTDPVDAVPAR